MSIKRALGGLVLLSMVSTSACDSGDRDGICPGDYDGEIYYIQALNFINQRITTYVDERRVGEVAIYDEADHVPGFTDFGYFPQCVDSEIGFGGSEEIDFNEVIWTRTALESYTNGCALEFWLVTDPLEDSGYPDWTAHGQLLPGSYRDAANRPECSPGWALIMEIDGDPAEGTPTPTSRF